MEIRVLGKICAVSGLLMVAACAMDAPVVVKAPEPLAPIVAPKPTALTDEAAGALIAAEQSVIEARTKRSLWTRAVEHLEKARTAAKSFDSSATLSHAKEAIELCRLSIAQLDAPLVRW
jgi:hypothetical protein